VSLKVDDEVPNIPVPMTCQAATGTDKLELVNTR
jgi:hypothetical protein